MSVPEIIKELADLSLSISVIVALIFGITQVRVANRDRKERLTLESLRNFQSREFAELILYVTTKKMPATQKEMRALPNNEQVMLIQFGQEMESLGMMVYENFIDIDLVDKTLGNFVSNSWENYSAMYLDMREQIPDPYLGEYFQWLAERIDERMKTNPRKPFYTNRRVPGEKK